HRFLARLRVQLVQDLGDVVLRPVKRDAELVRDLSVCPAPRHERQDLALARGELVRVTAVSCLVHGSQSLSPRANPSLPDGQHDETSRGGPYRNSDATFSMNVSMVAVLRSARPRFQSGMITSSTPA